MITSYRQKQHLVNEKDFFPFKDCLILDIETAKINPRKGINAENSTLKIWGAFSYNTGSVKMARENSHQTLQKIINSHRIIIGHNLKGFDIPILERELGISFKGKIIIDLLEVLRKPPSKAEKIAYEKRDKKAPTGKGRSLIIGEARQIGMLDNRFPDLKLGTIAKHGYKLFHDHPVYGQFFTEYKDDDFDYDVLGKKNITDEDWIYIKDYLRQDLIVTKNIFEFLEKYFESLMHYLPPADIVDLAYVSAPTGSYSYKAICHALNLPEEYGDMMKNSFPGAFVFLPIAEFYNETSGDGYCIDFASQHPSHQRMMNLYTPSSKCKHKKKGKCPTAHSGDGIIFNLKGSYCACEQGDIEKLITKWYIQRLKYKAMTPPDPREYTIKILINATYGISSSSIFKSIYNKHTGADTTLMSKQSTQYMDKWMRKAGYIVTYGDTDSLYIMDPFKDKERMKKHMAKGIANIKAILPFVDEHYNMDIDAEFSHIFFFTDKESKDKHYKKKNYIYILQPNKRGEVKVKLNGLPILKSNAPRLAKVIYTKYLEKEIKRTKKIKFDKSYIQQLIQHELSAGFGILAVDIRCNPASSYARVNQIQAKISEKYLGGKAGTVKVLKHKKKGLGVGVTTYYCSATDNLELGLKNESKQLGIGDLDLKTVWKVLDPFVKEDKQINLTDLGFSSNEEIISKKPKRLDQRLNRQQ